MKLCAHAIEQGSYSFYLIQQYFSKLGKFVSFPEVLPPIVCSMTIGCHSDAQSIDYESEFLQCMNHPTQGFSSQLVSLTGSISEPTKLILFPSHTSSEYGKFFLHFHLSVLLPNLSFSHKILHEPIDEFLYSIKRVIFVVHADTKPSCMPLYMALHSRVFDEGS